MKLPVLPTYYYHDHFEEMLAFVSKTYGSILTAEHHEFVSRFQKFSKDAQCLLIRMVNRRGAIFNRQHFRYPEISDIDRALSELIACGQVRGLLADDYSAFLRCVPKDKLLTGARAAGCAVRTSWPKPKLVEHLLNKVPSEDGFAHCGAGQFIVVDNMRPIEFLLYLYFGKTEDDLKNFALRDLGIMRTNKAASFSARFTNGDEARACFYYSKILDRLELKSVGNFERAATEVLDGPCCPTDYAADIRNRAAHLAGQFFEKRGDHDLAEKLYRAGSSADCHERLVRLLYARGYKESAEELLRRMIDDPASDDEFMFATDFFARKFNGRRTGLCTELLRASRTITVDDTHRGNPETGVAGVMRREGHCVFFAENTLWHSLFGLLFWDELFESGQLHSGFDWTPHCLKDRSFARTFASQVEAKLAAIRSGQALPLILKTIAARYGRPNGVFEWRHVNVDALKTLLAGASPDGTASIIRAMGEDYRSMRDGFPDLMLAKDGQVKFIEIKAEGDVIRRNQLTRLRQLGKAGITAEIGRVDYRFDPEQDYVVVDIETIGSWSSGDRITEIGAVKIRNHEVVGEWHSLLNSQRVIPSRIV